MQRKLQKTSSIEGHKVDIFYPQVRVTHEASPDSLALTYIETDLLRSHKVEQKTFDDLEMSRAHNLLGSSSRLSKELYPILEAQYIDENHYTPNGYHHYAHEEGQSSYYLTFNHSKLKESIGSNGDFSVCYGPDLMSFYKQIHSFSKDQVANGRPMLSCQFVSRNQSANLSGAFFSVIQDESKMPLQAGDLLVLIGDFAHDEEAKVQNACLSVILKSKLLGEEFEPISRSISLEELGLLEGIKKILVEDFQKGGASLILDEVLLSKEKVNFEDSMWHRSLKNAHLLVVPFARKHILKPIVEREFCHWHEIGELTDFQDVVVRHRESSALNLAKMTVDELLKLGHVSKPSFKKFAAQKPSGRYIPSFSFEENLKRLLESPEITDKTGLLTQLDRSSGGLVARDSFVGPWQVPVAHLGVTISEFKDYLGEALTVVSSLSQSTPENMLGHAITRLSAAAIDSLSDIHLLIPENGVDTHFQKSLKVLCENLNISLDFEQVNFDASFSPDALVGFSPVHDVRKTMTAQWVLDEETILLALVLDTNDEMAFRHYFETIQTFNKDDLLLAYHDFSSGGIALALMEMAFCSHAGFNIDFGSLAPFDEKVGAILQIRASDEDAVINFLEQKNLASSLYFLGKPTLDQKITFKQKGTEIFSGDRAYWHQVWSKPDYLVQKERKTDLVLDQTHNLILDESDPGLKEVLTFDPNKNETLPYMSDPRPVVGILRFVGSFGHLEMAAAFDRAGFECIDVHISDILRGTETLEDYVGLAVGGSGLDEEVSNWIKVVLESEKASHVFRNFFSKKERFTLATGNGFQWLSGLKDLIPEISHWPELKTNLSGHVENRFSLVKIEETNSIFFKGMEGSLLPVPVACKDGKIVFSDYPNQLGSNVKHKEVSLCYANHYGMATENYPLNPTGSEAGVCALSSSDGRILGLMAHPERAFLPAQQSWHRRYVQEEGAWMRVFRNARLFVG